LRCGGGIVVLHRGLKRWSFKPCLKLWRRPRQFREIARRQRSAEQEALHFIAGVLAQELLLPGPDNAGRPIAGSSARPIPLREIRSTGERRRYGRYGHSALALAPSL